MKTEKKIPGDPTPPSDQAVRQRFITELDRNFSVIAPAGVGKTRAIVDRVIEIATKDFERAREWLPTLVVVTYTNKAADEMNQRARNEIIGRRVDLSVLTQFNRAFFGTIHSFCLRLLKNWGHYLGLPAQLELPEDEDVLWREFVLQLTEVGRSIPAEVRQRCFRHLPLQSIIELSRKLKPSHFEPAQIAEFPRLNFDELILFTADGKNVKNVEAGKQILKNWIKDYESSSGFLPLPDYAKGGRAFVHAWQTTFAPLRTWLSEVSWEIAQELALQYRAFRLAKGKVTYDDQIELVVQLLRHPVAGRLLRDEGYRIILDEAQDTDPSQFDVLIELARAPEACQHWSHDDSAPPRPGHFCMVGDPQQSIYGDRANLAHYQTVRDYLKASGASGELTLEVTFRCDEAIVDTVNRLAPAMLDGKDGQTEFVPLKSRPGVGPGQVIRWMPGVPSEAGETDGKLKVDEAALAEGRQLAAWLEEQGLEKLRAPSWSEVAILCPRKRWFPPIERALREAGFSTQIHSQRDSRGAQAAYAWFTALLTIAVEPENTFETVGVLREVFGIADEELAYFSHGNGAVFSLEQRPTGAGIVAEALRALYTAGKEAARLPLRDAVIHLVKAVWLRERLRGIAEYEQEDCDKILDSLLVLSAKAEAEGRTLRQWVDVLKRDFDSTIEGEPVNRDAVQLITCHKAKGLQWHAVVLPLLHRSIVPNRQYPLLIHREECHQPMVAFSSADIADFKHVLELRDRHELQRLLYVAMTRARKTLVVVDDGLLHRGVGINAFASCLNLSADTVSGYWKALPDRLTPEKKSGGKTEDVSPGVQALVPLETEYRAKAKTNAAGFAHRILPYSLSEHLLKEDPEAWLDSEPEAAHEHPGREAALEYGLWWHALMESLEWSQGPASWKKQFDKAMAKAPTPERGVREWALFIGSDLARYLSNPAVIVRTEMPFLWRRNPTRCVEGMMDLAAYDSGTKKWLVIDWKTNLVAPDRAHTLQTLYAPQISAYVEAIRSITEQEARGALYSTATGRVVDCT